MFWSQKVCRGDNILLEFTEKTGGLGNPSATIHANAFRTTNFRSRSAMRGAEIHGNNRRDGATRIPSIECRERDAGLYCTTMRSSKCVLLP